MSDPTILTSVTAEAPATPSILSRISGKSSSILWILVVALIVAVIFLYMWRRGDRMALLQIKRNQMQCVRVQDCAAMIEESISTYDRIRQTTQVTQITETQPDPIPEQEEDEEEESDDEGMSIEEESSSEEEEEEEEEEEDDYTKAMSSDDEEDTPPPPPTSTSSDSSSSSS